MGSNFHENHSIQTLLMQQRNQFQVGGYPLGGWGPTKIKKIRIWKWYLESESNFQEKY